MAALLPTISLKPDSPRVSISSRASASSNGLDPAERRHPQDRRDGQDREGTPIAANQLLLKGRRGSEPQTFFMRQIIDWGVGRRNHTGPIQAACEQIRAAVANEFKKLRICVKNSIKLTGNLPVLAGFLDQSLFQPVELRLLVSLTTVAKVAYDCAKPP